MQHLVSDAWGWVHLFASVIALVAGTLVLWLEKGTVAHKRIGYLYALSMVVLLSTAFMIYRLFHNWGIFHWMAVVSALTIACGLWPILSKWPRKQYISLHLSFMYWSVMGLYGAFAAETMVRLPKIVIESGVPNKVFYQMSGLAVGLTMAIGAFAFFRLRDKWDSKFRGE
ncbi:MAG: hypothetical protein KF734_18550 [Saprospiraceae bacterium]|nr:hypothetical protein [Saprospiraceae bacterium]